MKSLELLHERKARIEQQIRIANAHKRAEQKKRALQRAILVGRYYLATCSLTDLADQMHAAGYLCNSHDISLMVMNSDESNDSGTPS